MRKYLLLSLLSISAVLAACVSFPQMTQQEMQQKYTQEIDIHFQMFDQLFREIWEEHYNETEITVWFSPKTKLQWTIEYFSQTQTKWQDEYGIIDINADIKNFSKDFPLIITGTFETHLQNQSMFVKILTAYLFAWPRNDEIKFINLLFQQLQGKWLALSTGENAIISVISLPTASEIRQILQYFLWDNQADHYDTTSAKLLISLLTELFDLPISGQLQTQENISEVYTIKNKEIMKTSTYRYKTEFNILNLEIKSSASTIEFLIKDIQNIESWEIIDFSFNIKIHKKKEKIYSITIQEIKENETLLDLQGKLTFSKEGQQTHLVYEAEITFTPIKFNQGEMIGMQIKGKTSLSPEFIIMPSFTGEILRLSDIIEGF